MTFQLPNDTLLCSGESLLIDLSHLNGEFNWNNGSSSDQLLIQQPGLYHVRRTQHNCSDADTMQVFFDSLSVNLGKDTALCDQQAITLYAKAPNAHYLWQDGSTNASFTASRAGTYSVRVTNDLCADTDSIFIEQIPCDKVFCKIFAPNVFSPNNDGVNDFFQPFTNCELELFTLQIFDRWGNALFGTSNPNESWDGTSNNQELPQGVYIFKIEYKFSQQVQKETLFNTVTIVR